LRKIISDNDELFVWAVSKEKRKTTPVEKLWHIRGNEIDDDNDGKYVKTGKAKSYMNVYVLVRSASRLITDGKLCWKSDGESRGAYHRTFLPGPSDEFENTCGALQIYQHCKKSLEFSSISGVPFLILVENRLSLFGPLSPPNELIEWLGSRTRPGNWAA